jgi:branched-subunit amino acid ABC-type transport system permease component
MFGMWMLLKGLVAAMLGGLGSVRGVLWGGLFLGVVEAFAQSALGAQGREFATYALLFFVLVAPWKSRQALVLSAGLRG